MSNKNPTETVAFKTDELRRDNIKQVLKQVQAALAERGYNAVNQLSGYLISDDPAYISSHKNARNLIQTVERYEIIEELVRTYLEEKAQRALPPATYALTPSPPHSAPPSLSSFFFFFKQKTAYEITR